MRIRIASAFGKVKRFIGHRRGVYRQGTLHSAGFLVGMRHPPILMALEMHGLLLNAQVAACMRSSTPHPLDMFGHAEEVEEKVNYSASWVE